MIRYLLVLIFAASALVACNQWGIGAASAVKNFFKTPIDAVGGFVARDRFRSMERETREEERQRSPAGETLEYCLDNTGRPVTGEAMDDIAAILGAVERQSCQCAAWGNCPTEICSCDVKCPSGFGIFKHPVGMTPQSLSTPENGLAFRNGGGNGTIESTNGYCWGHARVTSQFNRLAFFKPDARAPFDLNSPEPRVKEMAVNYYKNIIDKVTSNEAVEIPGFPNLLELSSNPDLQSYLADKVARSWSGRAMSWQGMRLATETRRKSNDHYRSEMQKIKDRIDLNMQPTIVFTARGGIRSMGQTHAVLVSHYETQGDGSLKLCLRDNNYSESETQSCRNHMTFSEERGLQYNRWGEIGGFDIAFNDDDDAVAQARNLREKCQRENGCSRD